MPVEVHLWLFAIDRYYKAKFNLEHRLAQLLLVAWIALIVSYISGQKKLSVCYKTEMKPWQFFRATQWVRAH